MSTTGTSVTPWLLLRTSIAKSSGQTLVSDSIVVQGLPVQKALLTFKKTLFFVFKIGLSGAFLRTTD